tara:strand:+ start:14689 stop:15372 length:684 start_codon:yes stop_codon:yes gene_type:complete
LLLDTTHNIGTPEGVELKLPAAGLAPRSLAWLIDAMIKYTAVFVMMIVLGLFGKFGSGVSMIALFLLLWFYNVLFEVFNNGATPGKRALGLRVMNINGTPVDWSGSLIRNLIRFVDALPGCYAFGCTSVLLTKNFQRLGDLAAGTFVIHQPKKSIASKPNNAKPVAVILPLSLDEQHAIVSFGERASSLNTERSAELAKILQPVLPDVDAERLQGHASWLAGSGRNQ